MEVIASFIFVKRRKYEKNILDNAYNGHNFFYRYCGFCEKRRWSYEDNEPGI